MLKGISVEVQKGGVRNLGLKRTDGTDDVFDDACIAAFLVDRGAHLQRGPGSLSCTNLCIAFIGSWMTS